MKKIRVKQETIIDLKSPDFWESLGIRLDEVAGHQLIVTDEITGRSLEFLTTDKPGDIYQSLHYARKSWIDARIHKQRNGK